MMPRPPARPSAWCQAPRSPLPSCRSRWRCGSSGPHPVLGFRAGTRGRAATDTRALAALPHALCPPRILVHRAPLWARQRCCVPDAPCSSDPWDPAASRLTAPPSPRSPDASVVTFCSCCWYRLASLVCGSLFLSPSDHRPLLPVARSLPGSHLTCLHQPRSLPQHPRHLALHSGRRTGVTPSLGRSPVLATFLVPNPLPAPPDVAACSTGSFFALTTLVISRVGGLRAAGGAHSLLVPFPSRTGAVSWSQASGAGPELPVNEPLALASPGTNH